MFGAEVFRPRDAFEKEEVGAMMKLVGTYRITFTGKCPAQDGIDPFLNPMIPKPSTLSSD